MKKTPITKKSPILVVGFGSIGQRHYRNLCSLGYTNVSVYDTDQAKLVALGDKAVRTLSEKILTDFSVVFVCNPSHLHVKTALMAVKAGCHVFIEKPLAVSKTDLSLLERAAREKGVTAMVACNYRFHEAYLKLKGWITKATRGKPLVAELAMGHDLKLSRSGVDYRRTYAAKRSQGGGVIFDSGPHAVDYLMGLFGTPRRVNALKGDVSSLQLATEDYASIEMEFKSGLRAHLFLDYFSVPKRNFIEVHSEHGSARSDFAGLEFIERGKEKADISHIPLYKNKERTEAVNASYLAELKYFFDVVSGKQPPVSDLTHAKKVTEILFAIEHSAKTLTSITV